MSLAGTELCLFDLGNSGRARRSFLEDRGAFLERYILSDAERASITEENIGALFQSGVNPMLLMGFHMGLHGPTSMSDYLKKMPTLASIIGEKD